MIRTLQSKYTSLQLPTINNQNTCRIRAKINTGHVNYRVTGGQSPAFLYEDPTKYRPFHIMDGFMQGYYLVQVCNPKILYDITDALSVFLSSVPGLTQCHEPSFHFVKLSSDWCDEKIRVDNSHGTDDHVYRGPGKSLLVISCKFDMMWAIG